MKYRESFEYLGTGFGIIFALELILGFTSKNPNWVVAFGILFILFLYFLFITKTTYFELEENKFIYTDKFFSKTQIPYDSIKSIERRAGNLTEKIFGKQIYINYTETGTDKQAHISFGFKQKTLSKIVDVLKSKNSKIEVKL